MRKIVSILLFVLFSLTLQAADDARLKAMQKEKLRIKRVRQVTIRKGLSFAAMAKEAYKNIAAGNAAQFEDHKDLLDRLLESVEQAEKKRQKERLETLGKLVLFYKFYGKQNLAIVEAYKKGKFEDIDKAIVEIMRVEKAIFKLTGRVPKRKWFTFAELDKVPYPGQKKQKETQSAKKE